MMRSTTVWLGLALLSLIAPGCRGGLSSAQEATEQSASSSDTRLIFGDVDAISSRLPQSRLIGGAPFEPNAYWPPTGMDCAVTMGEGSPITEPPQAFTDSCSSCHGPSGEGRNGYPSVKVMRSFIEFTQILRAGRKGTTVDMPAFPSQWLPDNDLQRIYSYLTGTPLREHNSCTPRPPMSDSAMASALSTGLAMWRKQDGRTDPNGVTSNVACVQCHAPDPLDLAYLGFGDGDILRRGSLHLTVEEIAPIVDYVHAMRQKYAIGRRDPLVARPFQPGGGMLPGNSIAERDAAFGAQLKAQGLKIVSAPLGSVADAEAAYRELAAVDKHMLRIPVPFNHYVEDINFNDPNDRPDCDSNIDACHDHGSIADWIPSAPHVPSSLANYFNASDNYLNAPNDTTFAALRSALPSGNTMPGTYAYGTMTLDDAKYRSELLHNYCIRLELLGQKGCYDRGIVPFPNHADPWNVGSTINLFGTNYASQPSCDTTWTNCADAPAKLPQWPEHILADLTPGSTLSSNFSRLRHPWMTLWWVHFDPVLLSTGDPTAQKDEYFTRSLLWSNLNDFQFSGTPQSKARPTYAIFAAWEVMMHNISVLENPQYTTCSVWPSPDFACTTVDLRSGYFPNVINFAEQNQPQNPETANNINYQVRFMPTDPEARATYQLLTANMYRMFFYRLIGALQADPYICNASLQRLRMTRAQSFLTAAETQKEHAASDAAMFSQLDNLLSSAPARCPSLPSN